MSSAHDERKFKCNSCPKEVTGAQNLKSHERSHKVKSCDECSQQFPMNTLPSHQNKCQGVIIENVFKCTTCPYVSNRANNLKKHMKTHKKDEKMESKQLYVCKQCNKTFSMKNYLTKHEEIHKKVTPSTIVQCDLCTENFTQRKNLKRRMLAQHLQTKQKTQSGHFGVFEEVKKMKEKGIKQFICDQCIYTTPRSADLKRHKERNHEKIKVNTKVDPQCPQCNYYSDKTSTIKEHIQRKHGIQPKKSSRATNYRKMRKEAEGEFKDYFENKTKKVPEEQPIFNEYVKNHIVQCNAC